MIYLYAFLLFGLVGFPVLFLGYIFVMGALGGKKRGMPRLMVVICTVLAFPFIVLDGLLNMTWGALLTGDFRLRNAFKLIRLKGVPLIVPELLTERFFKCLNATGVRVCIASHARMPSPREQIERAQLMDAGPFIARWSLHSGFKYETAKAKYFPFNKIVDEDPDSRESLVQESIRTLDAGFPVYVVINNKAEGSAPLSVGKFAQRFVEVVANSRKGS